MKNTHRYNNHELLLAISNGNEQAFNQLFSQYRNQLFTYIFKITKSKETAEEIVLDVFLKIWNSRQALRELKNIDAFLAKIAHNQSIDFLRAAKRDKAIQAAVWNQLQQVAAAISADDDVQYKSIASALNDGVKQLTPQRQKVFKLQYQGLTYDEIAKRLKLSAHTVRNHIAASRRFIQQFLDEQMCTILIITTLTISS
ncbi:MAG: RNA polymerase sigma factor [Agriterribacter sp.]